MGRVGTSHAEKTVPTGGVPQQALLSGPNDRPFRQLALKGTGDIFNGTLSHTFLREML